MSRKLLRKRDVAERYGGVHVRTIERWLADPELKFPQPMYINSLPFWNEFDLEKWERHRATRQRAESAA